MEFTGKLILINKINAKMIYWKFIVNNEIKPTAQRHIEKTLKRNATEWSFNTMKVLWIQKMLAFHYEIVNNLYSLF